jgi:hypothetical protein
VERNTSVKTLLVILLIVLITSPPFADEKKESFTKAPKLEWVGSWPFGPIWCAEIDTARNLLFAGSGGGVLILDISNPKNPKIVSDALRPKRTVFYDIKHFPAHTDYSLMGRISDLSYHHERLYAAAHNSITVWDIADPKNPRCVIESPAFLDSAHIFCMAVKENLIFIGYRSGFYILDAENDTFTIVAHIELDAAPFKMLVNGNYLYLCCRHKAVKIFNIEDLEEPTLVSEIESSAQIWDIAIWDNHLFLGLLQVGIKVYNIQQLQNPIEESHIDVSCRQMYINNTTLYATAAGGGMSVLDISNIRNVSIVDTLSYQCSAYDIHGYGGYLYISCGELAIFDISEKKKIEFLTDFDHAYAVLHCDIDGTSMVVPNDDYGLYIFDITDPTYPLLKGNLKTDLKMRGALIKNNYVYCTDEEYFYIIDITDPVHPVSISKTLVPNVRKILLTEENMIFMRSGDSTIYLYDVSNKSEPIQLSVKPVKKYPISLYYKDNYLYIASFKTIDIYEKEATGSLVLNKQIPAFYKHATCTAVHDNQMYVLDGIYLEIFSLKTPDIPSEISKYCIPDSVERSTSCIQRSRFLSDIVFIDQWAIAMAAFDGLRVFDLANSAKPEQVSRISGMYYINGIHLENNYLYISENFTGIHIFKIVQGSTKTK